MSFSTTYFALVLLLLWFQPALARSAPPPPIKRLAHPSTLGVDILPRRVSHQRRSLSFTPPTLDYSDSFRLTLSAFNETFHLHLRPNDDLIHPNARIHYYSLTPSGEEVLSRTEPLLRSSVMAYLGEVIPGHLSAARMRQDAAGVIFPPKGPELGWARIVVYSQGDAHRGIPPIFEGAFSVRGDIHHIMTKDNYLRTKQPLDPDLSTAIDDSSLVIWRDSDIVTYGRGTGHAAPAHTCGHDHFPYNTDPTLNPMLRRRHESPNPWFDSLSVFDTLTKRQDAPGAGINSNFSDFIGDSSGCPKTPKVLYMGVAADCMYTGMYGGQQNATQKILNNWNTASGLYKMTFNVTLGIVELQVRSATCPSPPSDPWNVDCSTVQLNERLSLFSAWRGQKGDDGAGLWHLMSGCPSGSEVGIAWLGTLCSQTSSGQDPSVVSGTAVSTSGRTEWQIVAHEMGHNFGAIHDCTDGCPSSVTCCPFNTQTCSTSSDFLMSPTSQPNEMAFSPCSIGNICSMMIGVSAGQTNTTCLVDPDPNRPTISLQQCGNGIVEAGEDCDPGNGVNSTCCNTATCKFLPGAFCDPASSSCCQNDCTFAPTTTVCRPARDPLCDIAEVCTGNSSSCPSDIVAKNGQACGTKGQGLTCASGICTSLAKQCQAAGASMGLSAPCPILNDKSCQVSCQDPLQSDQCIVLNSQLIDGSPCGFGGTCLHGKCQPGDFASSAKAWFRSNLQISIPVTVVAGIITILLLLALIRSIRRRVRSRRERKLSSVPAVSGWRSERLNSWNNLPQDVPASGPPVPQGQRNLPPPPPSFPQQHSRAMSAQVDGAPGQYMYTAPSNRPPRPQRPPGSVSSGSSRNIDSSRRFSRSADYNSRRAAQPSGPQYNFDGSWDAPGGPQYEYPGPPPPVPVRDRSRQPPGWVDPTPYNGPP